MTNKKNITNPMPEDWFYLSLHEVTHSFGVTTETIIEIVNEGIVQTETNRDNELQFDSDAMRRIRTVLRLQRDLGVNLAGAGLAMDLMEEIERLRQLLAEKN